MAWEFNLYQPHNTTVIVLVQFSFFFWIKVLEIGCLRWGFQFDQLIAQLTALWQIGKIDEKQHIFFSNIIIVFNREIVIVRTERCFSLLTQFYNHSYVSLFPFERKSNLFVDWSQSQSQSSEFLRDEKERRRKKVIYFYHSTELNLCLSMTMKMMRESSIHHENARTHTYVCDVDGRLIFLSQLSRHSMLSLAREWNFTDSKRREEIDWRGSIRCRQIPLRHIIERWKISIYNFQEANDDTHIRKVRSDSTSSCGQYRENLCRAMEWRLRKSKKQAISLNLQKHLHRLFQKSIYSEFSLLETD